ncbi:hypothetical protein [Caballeronia glathei]|jgi:hypothetical protein|uniref:hypothetical protein n=1 Tax=Caballeronia glathei TaxID=60547 RepID=UPI000A7B6630|nr:hypothetical protein [Caballeronia glathei]
MNGALITDLYPRRASRIARGATACIARYDLRTQRDAARGGTPRAATRPNASESMVSAQFACSRAPHHARNRASRRHALHPPAIISNHTITYKRTRLVILRIAKLASRIHTEKPMKKLAILAALSVLLGSALSGCIVVPAGDGYHHHRDYYRY